MTKTETIISDIYDAWRAQDLDRLASYLPDDFSHMIYIPKEVHPLGGLCRGKEAAVERLGRIAMQSDFLRFETNDALRRKSRCNTASNPQARSSIRPKRISGRSRPGGR
jgi:ketosteroid isomerase-like protein